MVASPEEIVPEGVFKKIADALALSHRPGTPEEGAAAAAMVQKLLTKYNLELDEVERRQGKQKGIGGYTETGRKRFVGSKESRKWTSNLLNAIADNLFCDIVFWGPAGGRENDSYTIIGKRHNIDVVEHLFAYLVREIDRMAKESWSAHGKYTQGNHYPHYTRHFCLGAVMAVEQKLWEMRRSQEDQTKALVVRVDEELDMYIKIVHGELNWQRRSETRYVTEAQRRGYQAGRAINIHRVINPPP
jgi:hypothetical protein